MTATRAYDVIVNGHATTLLLSDADAKERGVFESPAAAKPEAAPKRAAAPKNKARTSRAAKPAAAAPVEDKGDDGSAGDA